MLKKNLYSGAELSGIKSELDKALTELALLPIETSEDEMDWRSGVNGTRTPYIISSIEDKLKTAMVVISDSIEQLKVVQQEEKFSDFVESKVFILETKLRQIQDYYESRTYSEASHRFLEKDYIGAKGKVIKLRLEAATKDTQVKTRSTIQKQILKLIPAINALKSEKGEEKQAKGNKGIPLSLQGKI
jgi:hypothetical protein